MFVAGLLAALSATAAVACDNCYGPVDLDIHTRHVRRMQPGALGAQTQPKGPLAWGQLNFIHTTDTHGWLEGHLKEHNYGADWGDFVSFTRHMRQKATQYGVDLLVVDTGDLHDGAGLSDATAINGNLSNLVFENVGYDLLTIGNHELYVTNIAYETATQFVQHYGQKYLTSNVKILNNATGQYDYIGQTHRYFTTPMGLRIMAFGVLFDFTGNTNYTQVITAANMTKEQWFIDAVKTTQPVDLFLLIGHNPVRTSDEKGFTMGYVQSVIRKMRPNIPIQVFGGHTHVRDFAVYDTMSTGLESGRYCETLGWLSMSGIKSSSYKGKNNPAGVPNPTQKAINVTAKTQPADNSPLRYFRRYIDWNRLSFEYHAVGSQSNTFNVTLGTQVSNEITQDRKGLNLSTLFGCAPQTYCISCAPFLSNTSIYSLLDVALAAEVVNTTRASTPRLIIINTGSIRFDLVQGPFTYDDSFIVSPFDDSFHYLSGVPYSAASQVLDRLNTGPYVGKRKRSLSTSEIEYTSTFPSPFHGADGCVDPPPYQILSARHPTELLKTRHRRATLTPGYTTTDDFGTTGDDTPHSKIPYHSTPTYFQTNASLPTTGQPDTIDLIFLDYIADDVLDVLYDLKPAGHNYTTADVEQYLPKTFTTNSYLPAYAQKYWSKGPVCPIGQGVGG